jgi:hypothetical protein
LVFFLPGVLAPEGVLALELFVGLLLKSFSSGGSALTFLVGDANFGFISLLFSTGLGLFP